MTQNKYDQGYLYIATGESYIKEALVSIKSLRKLAPHIHATLITDKPLALSEFDEIKVFNPELGHKKGWKSAVLYQVFALSQTPYQKTFFIDSDTYFAESCEELFELLDYYDLLIAHAPADTSNVKLDDQTVEGYYPYNTGVIVYKKNKAVNGLLKDWFMIYRDKFDTYDLDQAPLMEALLHNPVHLYVLQPIYNFRLPLFVSLPGTKVKIFHGRATDFTQLEKIINSEETNRVWNPWTQKVISKSSLVKQKVLKFTPKKIIELYLKAKSKLRS